MAVGSRKWGARDSIPLLRWVQGGLARHLFLTRSIHPSHSYLLTSQGCIPILQPPSGRPTRPTPPALAGVSDPGKLNRASSVDRKVGPVHLPWSQTATRGPISHSYEGASSWSYSEPLPSPRLGGRVTPGHAAHYYPDTPQRPFWGPFLPHVRMAQGLPSPSLRSELACGVSSAGFPLAGGRRET